MATAILEGFKGYLHCDGYSGYKNIPNLDLVGYWAHVRRKFFEIPGNNGKAKKTVEYCIGHKKYLFSTSMKGAVANVMAYTVIETAKENELNPSKYLNYLFEKLPNIDFIRNPDILVGFLPWAKNVQEICQ